MARIDIGERLGRMLGVRIGDASYMTSLPVDIGHEPDFEDGVQLRPGPEDGQVTAGYLLRDEDPGDYFRDADGRGSLRVFTDQADRDDWIAQCEEAGDIPLVVDRYAHGAEHWSVANTSDYPDRRWDVAPCGVFCPCEDVVAGYRARVVTEGPEAAREWLVADSNAVLSEYSQVVNGDVYATAVETWERDPEGGLRRIREDFCGGFIGRGAALEALKAEMPSQDMQEPVP